jgi:hypothetical protein
LGNGSFGGEHCACHHKCGQAKNCFALHSVTFLAIESRVKVQQARRSKTINTHIVVWLQLGEKVANPLRGRGRVPSSGFSTISGLGGLQTGL